MVKEIESKSRQLNINTGLFGGNAVMELVKISDVREIAAKYTNKG